MSFGLFGLSVGLTLDEGEVQGELGLLLVKGAQLEMVLAGGEGEGGVVCVLEGGVEVVDVL